MKKILVILLITILSLTLIAGCGKKQETQEQAPATEETQQAPTTTDTTQQQAETTATTNP